MPPINENSLYEAFGLQAPQQVPAAPTQSEPAPAAGAKEPEVADPAQEGEGTAAAPAQEGAQPAESKQEGAQPQEGNPTAAQGKGEQSQQERRENAARRRRAEEQARIDAAVERAVQEEKDRAQANMAAFFEKAKLKNTITGEPITTMEQFNAWNEAFTAQKLNRELAAGKLTLESLHKAIEDSPVVKKAQEIIRNSEQEAQRREQEAAQARIDADLQEIRKHDPTIRELKDLVAMPSYPKFREYVNKGLSFKEAYYLANREAMTAAAAQAARQQAASNARSKNHLTGTNVQGDGAMSVPPEQMKLYQMLMPKATKAEIQAHYNAQKRGS